MSANFNEIAPEQIEDNPFKLIGADWMLITAGSLNAYNTMTASWGGMGSLWDKNVCFCFVRPTRHTFKFMEEAHHFTLSFFSEEHRKTLAFCGANSGRTVDKAAKTGLTPIAGEQDTVFFEQARLVVVCRKIYFQDLISQHFLDPSIGEFYAGNDHHRMYVGEVVKVLTR